MLEFLTEQDYDLLWVNGQSYSYTEGPDGVEAEGQIEWTSDTQGTEKGWSICADSPTPSPTSPISVVGMCDADDWCVSSPKSPQNYGKLFFCSITFDVDATLHVVEFEIDFLLTFHFWRTGWSTFGKILQHSQAGSTMLLIDGHVRPYTAAPCAPAFLQEVRMNGYVVAARVCAGSLESSEPFEVSADGQRSRVDPHGTQFCR